MTLKCTDRTGNALFPAVIILPRRCGSFIAVRSASSSGAIVALLLAGWNTRGGIEIKSRR